MKAIIAGVAMAAVIAIVLLVSGGSSNGSALNPSVDEGTVSGTPGEVPAPPISGEGMRAPSPVTIKVTTPGGLPVPGCTLEPTVLGSVLGSRETNQNGEASLGEPGFYSINLIPPPGFTASLVVGHITGHTVLEIQRAGRVLVKKKVPCEVELVHPDIARHMVSYDHYLGQRDDETRSINYMLDETISLAEGDETAVKYLSSFGDNPEGLSVTPRWDVFSVPQEGLEDNTLTFFVPPDEKGYSIFASGNMELMFWPARGGIRESDKFGFTDLLFVEPGKTLGVDVYSSTLSVYGCFDFGLDSNVDQAVVTLYGERWEDSVNVPIMDEKTVDLGMSGFGFEFYDVNPGPVRVTAVGKSNPASGGPQTIWISSSEVIQVERGVPKEAVMKVGEYSVSIESGFCDSSGKLLDTGEVVNEKDPGTNNAMIHLMYYLSIKRRGHALKTGEDYSFFWDTFPFTFGEPLEIRGLWAGELWTDSDGITHQDSNFWVLELTESPELRYPYTKPPYGAEAKVDVVSADTTVEMFVEVSTQ